MSRQPIIEVVVVLGLALLAGCCESPEPSPPSTGVYGNFWSGSDGALACGGGVRDAKVCAAPPETTQHPSNVADTNLDCTSSDANGDYTLILAPGTYRICLAKASLLQQCDQCIVVIESNKPVRRDMSLAATVSWASDTSLTCE
jgi:hypothetical protein